MSRRVMNRSTRSDAANVVRDDVRRRAGPCPPRRAIERDRERCGRCRGGRRRRDATRSGSHARASGPWWSGTFKQRRGAGGVRRASQAFGGGYERIRTSTRWCERFRSITRVSDVRDGRFGIDGARMLWPKAQRRCGGGTPGAGISGETCARDECNPPSDAGRGVPLPRIFVSELVVTSANRAASVERDHVARAGRRRGDERGVGRGTTRGSYRRLRSTGACSG